MRAGHKPLRYYHVRSGNPNDGWNVTGTMSLRNQPLRCMATEVNSPVLFFYGEKACSHYFSEGAFEKMTSDGRCGANDVVGILPRLCKKVLVCCFILPARTVSEGTKNPQQDKI